jgi:hypothetical protein
MTAILLPASPRPRKVTPGVIDFGVTLSPFLGGTEQRVSRLGSRYSLSVDLVPMYADPDGRIWQAALERARSPGNVAQYPWPQPLLVIGAPGVPSCYGASSGTSLALQGFAAGYTMRRGQALSLLSGGRRYLHRAQADTTADGSGRMTLPILPMLRVSVVGGEAVEVANPVIEGLLQAAPSVDIDWGKRPLFSFTIRERG